MFVLVVGPPAPLLPPLPAVDVAVVSPLDFAEPWLDVVAWFAPVAELVALPPLPAAPELPPAVLLTLVASPVAPVDPVEPE